MNPGAGHYRLSLDSKRLRQATRSGSSLVWIRSTAPTMLSRWRRWSLGIGYFLRDDGLQTRLDAVRQNQIHGRRQEILQVELQVHVVVNSGLTRFHEYVDIAFGARHSPSASQFPPPSFPEFWRSYHIGISASRASFNSTQCVGRAGVAAHGRFTAPPGIPGGCHHPVTRRW